MLQRFKQSVPFVSTPEPVLWTGRVHETGVSACPCFDTDFWRGVALLFLAPGSEAGGEEDGQGGLSVLDLPLLDQLKRVREGHRLDGQEFVGLMCGFSTLESGS